MWNVSWCVEFYFFSYHQKLTQYLLWPKIKASFCKFKASISKLICDVPALLGWIASNICLSSAPCHCWYILLACDTSKIPYFYTYFQWCTRLLIAHLRFRIKVLLFIIDVALLYQLLMWTNLPCSHQQLQLLCMQVWLFSYKWIK